MDSLGRGSRGLPLRPRNRLEDWTRAGSGKSRKLDQIEPKRSVSPLGDALARRRSPIASRPADLGPRSSSPTAGPTPVKTPCESPRPRPGSNIPIYPVAAGGEEGPRNVRLAEIEASPVVFAKDPMTIAVVAEARGLKDAEASLDSRTARQRRRIRADCQPADRSRRGRCAQADDVPGRAQGHRPVRLPIPDRGRRAGADAPTTTRPPLASGLSASRSAS